MKIESIKDVQTLIKNQTEEDTYLEYKAADKLTMLDRCKKDVSVSVSSFANPDGGTIVYGIKEEKNKPVEIDYIDRTIYTKEWLDQVIQSNIKRIIDGYNILPIPNPSNENECIYVVRIPRSDNAPHQANTTTDEMEEYEIRDAYSRGSKVTLANFKLNVTQKVKGNNNYIVFNVTVENVSRSIERDYKLVIASDSPFNPYSMSGGSESMYSEADRTQVETNMGVTYYVIDRDDKIFQGERIVIITDWHLQYNLNQIDMYENFKIKLKLFYSGGILVEEYTFKELIESDIPIF